MPSLPRLAIGTIQEGADLQAVLMALLDTLRRGGVQTQCFASRASLPGQWASKAVTGLPGRFLDSWLMSPELCGDLLLRSRGGVPTWRPWWDSSMPNHPKKSPAVA